MRYLLIFFLISSIETYAREFTLILDKCDEDFLVDQFFETQDDGKSVYVCNVPMETVSPDKIINYYYQNRCPTGYQNLDKWNIDLIEQSIKACNTSSRQSLEEDKKHKYRLKWHRIKCPKGTDLLLDLQSFKGCKDY
tara:strand:+ start:174 stop:584 length:411 start_codon:yes stop_codon:yes gene_type:complete